MKIMRNYNDFMYERLVEGMRLKIVKGELILSKKLREILGKMDHQIADDLLAINRSPDAGPDYKKSFLDISDVPGEMSYIMVNKVPELLDDEEVWTKYIHDPNSVEPEKNSADYVDVGPLELTDTLGNMPGGYFETNPLRKPSEDDFDYDETDYKFPDVNYFPDLHDFQFTRKNHKVWSSKSRISQDVVRLINDLFPSKYPLNYTRKESGALEEKLNDRESFKARYIATIDENSKKIDEVSGADIIKFYNRENYLEQKGTLWGSCMADSHKGKYLTLYSKNPEKCSMAILYPEGGYRSGKIIGRAILWKIDQVDGEPVENFTFMDRIYTSVQADEELFILYAKKNGYYYKSTQAYGDYPIVHPETGENMVVKLRVDVKDIDYGTYPYMDTLSQYAKDKNYIANKGYEYNDGVRYGDMTSTGGSISW